MSERYWLSNRIEDVTGELDEFEKEFRSDNEELIEKLNLRNYQNWTDAEEKAFEEWFLEEWGGRCEYLDIPVYDLHLEKYESWSEGEKRAFYRLLGTKDAALRKLLRLIINDGLHKYCEDHYWDDSLDDDSDTVCDIHYEMIRDGIDWSYFDDDEIVRCIDGHPEILVNEDLRNKLIELLEETSRHGGYYVDCLSLTSTRAYQESGLSFNAMDMDADWDTSAALSKITKICPWASLIAVDPSVAKYCPDINGLSGLSRCYLIALRPEFEEKFNLIELRNPESDCWTNPAVAKGKNNARYRYSYGWLFVIDGWRERLKVQKQVMIDAIVEEHADSDIEGELYLPADADSVMLPRLSLRCRKNKVKRKLLDTLPHMTFSSASDWGIELAPKKAATDEGGHSSDSTVKVLFSHGRAIYDGEHQPPFAKSLEDYVILECRDEQELKGVINCVGMQCYHRGDMEEKYSTSFRHYGKNTVSIGYKNVTTCAVWVILESGTEIDVGKWDWESMNECYGRH